MRGITIRQPWAWSVAVGAKTVENRKAGFPAKYRGPVAIHAGQGWSERGFTDSRVLELMEQHQVGPRWPGPKPYLEGGVIVAVAELVDVHPSAGCCAPWGEDEYQINGGQIVRPVAHMVLEGIVEIPDPIPHRGALGLWTVPADVEQRIRSLTTALIREGP